jgi:hypothetical protein
MHFGDKATAYERAALASRQFVHTARLNGPRVSTMSDADANYSDAAGKAVRDGKIVPYTNAYENPGNTSYRALPEATKTWSQDVAADKDAHPALKHLASRGYNPQLGVEEAYETRHALQPRQDQLFAADVVANGKMVAAHVNEDDAFDHAHRLAATGTPAGVKRNNIVTIIGNERVKDVPTRLRPSTAPAPKTPKKKP